MFFINTVQGFVRDHQLLNHKYHSLSYCRDVREAKTFQSRELAEKFMAPACQALPHEKKWWAILSAGAGEILVVADVFPIIAEAAVVPLAA